MRYMTQPLSLRLPEATLDRLGIDENVELRRRRIVAALITRNPQFLKRYAEYMREHHGMTVEARPVWDAGRFRAYRMAAH